MPLILKFITRLGIEQGSSNLYGLTPLAACQVSTWQSAHGCEAVYGGHLQAGSFRACCELTVLAMSMLCTTSATCDMLRHVM